MTKTRPFYVNRGTLVAAGSILKITNIGYFEVVNVTPSFSGSNFYVGAAGIGMNDNRTFDKTELENMIFDDQLRIYNAS